MKIKFFCLSMLLTFSASIFAQSAGKPVIYIQDLLNKNSKGFKSLQKEAEKRNVILEWENYTSSRQRINNPSPAAGRVDFVIVEEVRSVTKGEWRSYTQRRYILKDAQSGLPLKYSGVIRSEFSGGCKPNGSCMQVQSNDKEQGTSKTGELVELIEYALTLEKALL